MDVGLDVGMDVGSGQLFLPSHNNNLEIIKIFEEPRLGRGPSLTNHSGDSLCGAEPILGCQSEVRVGSETSSRFRKN